MMRGVGALLLLLLACRVPRGSDAELLEESRPVSVRGWNSYNGWGGAVNETVLLQVADFMQAHMAQFGYNVLVLDEGWSKRDGQIITDAYGRPTPNVELYPSAAGGAGLKPLVEALAARGLKLGLWFVRGVPRSAAAKRLPIYGSKTNSTCLDAVRFDKPCFWSTSCHGSSFPSAAADEYYRSVAQMLQEWGVSFVKGDCFFPSEPYPGPQPHGYFEKDIVGFGSAMKTAGVTVSWSPGVSVVPANGTFIARNGFGVSYRVSEDMWDLWESSADGKFPTGIRQKLHLAENYAHLIGVNSSFPDWDMLPLGTMMHASAARGVYGPASPTRLTRDEQKTTMTLWSITRAPLMFGGRLPLDANDTWTLPLITNPEVLYVHNSSTNTRPLKLAGAPANKQHAWAATPDSCPAGSCAALAVFNAADKAQKVVVNLTSLHLDDSNDQPADSGDDSAPTKLCGRDLWTRRALVPTSVVDVFAPKVPPHGAGLYVLWRAHECTAGDEMFTQTPSGKLTSRS